MSSVALSISDGTPVPLGATFLSTNTINFAVTAPRASAVDLCLFWNSSKPGEEGARIRLNKLTHGVWHGQVEGIPKNCHYGYRVYGEWQPSEGLFFNHHKLLLDPYARIIDQTSVYHKSMRSLLPDGKMDSTDSAEVAPKGLLAEETAPFDWEGTRRPRVAARDSVFYEAHVKGFSYLNTKIPKKLRGTYAGLAHRHSIRYLKEMGITSVQLLPVHHHLDDDFLINRGFVNYWGYNTLGFFAPEYRYSATGNPLNEFREMVRTFHGEGMEVILDVVYNHTCETGPNGPTCMMRGYDNTGYYRTLSDNPGTYDDVTGCGNTVDTSKGDAMRLVLDSLRYWVEEMGVDGFRFDLAATLGRESAKGYSSDASFFRAVFQDPVLRDVKLIAEPWDIGMGGYQQGNFPTIWSELNGKFRDCVRQFWRGDPKVAGEFATRITGSADLFSHNGRLPISGLNMITSHDGFTLRDLVSYNQKHNEANGEQSRDGDSHNISFNHGAEGETTESSINELRKRQVRNFLATLICSQGIPFITAGDERFRTQLGNNNAYCQDSEISWLDWDEKDQEAIAMQRFVTKLLAFRREHSGLRKTRFFTGKPIDENEELTDVVWLNTAGKHKSIDDWSLEKSGAFAMMTHREANLDDESPSAFTLMFFNARQANQSFTFPKLPKLTWECLFDTVDAEGVPLEIEAEPGQTIHLAARSMQIWRER